MRAMQSADDLVCGLQATQHPLPKAVYRYTALCSIQPLQLPSGRPLILTPNPIPNPNPNLQGPYGILAVTKPAELLPAQLDCGFRGDVAEFLEYAPTDPQAQRQQPQ